MNNRIRIAVIVLIVVAAAAAFLTREPTSRPTPSAEPPPGDEAAALPTLIDLGRGECIPCKMMVPVLEELRTRHAGRLAVRYVDLDETPGAMEEYGVRTIPTQIFLDASGQEKFRHVGFWSTEEIEAKFKELGMLG